MDTDIFSEFYNTLFNFNCILHSGIIQDLILLKIFNILWPQLTKDEIKTWTKNEFTQILRSNTCF